MTLAEIEAVVIVAIRNTNRARRPEAQLRAAADSPVFGPESPLDSLGLVSLLIDIEEALQEHGYHVTLGDARAMSATHSPFRTVPSLVAYIHGLLSAA